MLALYARADALLLITAALELAERDMCDGKEFWGRATLSAALTRDAETCAMPRALRSHRQLIMLDPHDRRESEKILSRDGWRITYTVIRDRLYKSCRSQHEDWL